MSSPPIKLIITEILLKVVLNTITLTKTHVIHILIWGGGRGVCFYLESDFFTCNNNKIIIFFIYAKSLFLSSNFTKFLATDLALYQRCGIECR